MQKAHASQLSRIAAGNGFTVNGTLLNYGLVISNPSGSINVGLPGFVAGMPSVNTGTIITR